MARSLVCLVAVFVAASCFTSVSSSAELPRIINSFQSQERFEAAIRNTSSAPSFILYTVVDDRSGQAHTMCGIAPLLLGAIAREYGPPYDKAGHEKALEIALSSRDHIFHFTKQEALDNIPVRYSQEALISARNMLAGLSERPIRGNFPCDAAIACALIELGQSATMRDRACAVVAVP